MKHQLKKLNYQLLAVGYITSVAGLQRPSQAPVFHAETWSGMLNDAFKGPNGIKHNQFIFKELSPQYVASRHSHFNVQADLSARAYTLVDRVRWYTPLPSREKTQ